MEAINVRDMHERIPQVLDRVEAGEEVLILRRGKPAARIVKPSAERVAFRSRKGLREDLPPMRLGSGETVRGLRNAERF